MRAATNATPAGPNHRCCRCCCPRPHRRTWRQSVTTRTTRATGPTGSCYTTGIRVASGLWRRYVGRPRQARQKRLVQPVAVSSAACWVRSAGRCQSCLPRAVWSAVPMTAWPLTAMLDCSGKPVVASATSQCKLQVGESARLNPRGGAPGRWHSAGRDSSFTNVMTSLPPPGLWRLGLWAGIHGHAAQFRESKRLHRPLPRLPCPLTCVAPCSARLTLWDTHACTGRS
jgi:hypothetical protein